MLANLIKYIGQFIGYIFVPIVLALHDKTRQAKKTKSVGGDPDVQQAVDDHVRDSIRDGMHN